MCDDSDDDETKKEYILVFPGIGKSDFEQELNMIYSPTNRTYQRSNSDNIRTNIIFNHKSNRDYDKMPDLFINNETWPLTTKLHCWYCHNQCDSIPLALPLSYDRQTHSFKVMGCFNTWCCIVAYVKNSSEFTAFRKIELHNLILHFHEVITGKKIIDIQSAPVYTLQLRYGGSLSHIEYMEKLKELYNFSMI